MAIDSYSFCPAGTGKKIKFCCPDLLGDLKTLTRMIEGEQYRAALQHLESIESADSPRACLLAMKIILLRSLHRDEDAQQTVDRFLKHFPDNPVALAESAADLVEDPPAAMRLLQKALAVTPKEIPFQVYEAMSDVAETLAGSKHLRAARALWRLQAMVSHDDPVPRELLTRTSRSSDLPLLLKDEPPLGQCPSDAAWKQEREEALAPLAHAHWAEVARRLQGLLDRLSDEPALWRDLAVVRAWLAENAAAITALKKLSTLDIPLEDAVEAAATAMILADDPLGDAVDALRSTYTIHNADELAGLLCTWKLAATMPLDPEAFSEDEVPPKAAFWLLDRPTPASAEGLTLDTMSCVLGQATLLGRQTDRDARLVFTSDTSVDSVRAVKALVELAGDQITGPPEREALSKLSATQILLRRAWRLPPGTSRETVRDLAARHFERAVLEEWPRLKLGVLGGRSAEEAAAESSQRIKVLAAILVLEDWTRQHDERLDFNRLRSKLGLPTLDSIDPKSTPLATLPLVRLHRVEVQKLEDEELLQGFRRAYVFGAGEAIGVFGRELVARPGISVEDQKAALMALARQDREPQRAVAFIEQGRQLAESQRQSSAQWDLLELELWTACGNGPGVSRLFTHLQREHLREPGVAEALRDFLLRMGAIDERGRSVEPAADEMAAPEEAPEEPAAGLWTPDAAKPAGERPKLWTPGMS
jgi:hypothetical protein